MTPKILKAAALAACAAALAVAWLLTDSLGGWVILPLLASLTAAGLLIADDRRAPMVALLAGILQVAHAIRLLAQGPGPVPLALAYLGCAAFLAACGLGLRRYPPSRPAADPAPDLEDRPL